MAVMKTDLGDLKENAKRLRFEQQGSITATNVQDAIVQAATNPPGISGTSVDVAMSPYAVLPTDTVIYVDTSGGPVTIAMPAPAARNTLPLTIKDVSGNANANNITISGQTIDGIASPNYKINMDFGGVRLYPRTADYTVAP